MFNNGRHKDKALAEMFASWMHAAEASTGLAIKTRALSHSHQFIAGRHTDRTLHLIERGLIL